LDMLQRSVVHLQNVEVKHFPSMFLVHCSSSPVCHSRHAGDLIIGRLAIDSCEIEKLSIC
jgi:hypothetical protein